MGAKGYVAVEKTAEFAAAPAEKRVVGFLDKESLEPEQSLAALTDIALLLVGGTVGRLSGLGVVRSALRQLAVGGGAAAVTYVVGSLVGVGLG